MQHGSCRNRINVGNRCTLQSTRESKRKSCVGRRLCVLGEGDWGGEGRAAHLLRVAAITFNDDYVKRNYGEVNGAKDHELCTLDVQEKEVDMGNG